MNTIDQAFPCCTVWSQFSKHVGTKGCLDKWNVHNWTP